MVRGIDPNTWEKESQAMISIECPWCAGSATVDVADGDEFHCSGCAIRVEIAPGPKAEIPEPVTLAA
jgi:hypothetical protein